MAFQDRSNALQALEAEFQTEKASSLRKLEVKLEETLRELSEVERQLRSLRTADRRVQIARHQALRKEAEHQRWCFMVQREACGFVNHDDLDRYYPLPRPGGSERGSVRGAPGGHREQEPAGEEAQAPSGVMAPSTRTPERASA